jgi:hypothetical protein
LLARKLEGVEELERVASQKIKKIGERIRLTLQSKR